jgi:hypothetical protein
MTDDIDAATKRVGRDKEAPPLQTAEKLTLASGKR